VKTKAGYDSIVLWVKQMTINLKTEPFSLVLSGGGALGIAHLGVLHDLEQQKILPSEIIGTSMGGIIGACMAIGLREQTIFEKLTSIAGVFNWLKFSWGGNAVIDSARISSLFEDIFEGRTMGDTLIPLKLIATNLLNGHKKVFDAGDDLAIRDAVLATMAIPGIFSEQEIDGEVYADGFLCENLGINEASYQNILAVDVLGQHSFQKELPDRFFKTTKVLEMFEKSMRLLIYNQTRTNLRHSDRSIMLLEPDTRNYRTFHFHKTGELRSLGLGLLRRN
jgi:NTE family protein